MQVNTLTSKEHLSNDNDGKFRKLLCFRVEAGDTVLIKHIESVNNSREVIQHIVPCERLD